MNPAILRPCAALLVSSLFALPLAGQEGQGGQEAEPGLLPEVHLTASAADLSLRHGRRKTTAGSLGAKLDIPVRVALNDWAEVIAQHGLSVVLPEEASAVVLGAVDSKTLSSAAAVVDETWEMLEELHPAAGPRRQRAVMVFLFDEQGMGGGAWKAILETLVERNELVAQAAEHLGTDPGPLMLRGLPGFLQPTFDMAGDAAAGDDEFRLENEVAHKLTQCVLKERFGEVPESIRWGMGFLVEQRQFRSIYQLNATGFVASADHFDWPKKTREAILASYKEDGWSLSEHALRDDAAGQPVTPQMVTWGALDFLYSKDTEALAGLLTRLASLHDEAAGWLTNQSRYLGEPEATGAALAEALDAIDAKKLASHLKKLK